MSRPNWDIKKLLPKGEKSKPQDIVDLLLQNRGITSEEEKKEFLNPRNPLEISLESLKISVKDTNKAIKRIKSAINNKEKIIVFGDYDADGVSACGLMWESLYAIGADTLPYIPERFTEGYAIRFESVEKLKADFPNLGLIITVDNGIVAAKHIEQINNIGVDVIVTDHHKQDKNLPPAKAIIHSEQTSGSGVAWFFAREVLKSITPEKWETISKSTLDLAAIGTIADQLPLLSVNRSIAVYGLKELNNTKRIGIKEVAKMAGIDVSKIGIYEINFVIAPRINSMGRLTHAMDALRLICTTNSQKAISLASTVDTTNLERQKILEEVTTHARSNMNNDYKVIIISHESYHEGVIGLAASRLVEEFYRPAIVFSKGEKYSKASARSIAGFNIIESIRELSDLYVEGGGHPMAAGFTIETEKIALFQERFEKIAATKLTEDLLNRKLAADTVLSFNQLNWDLAEEIEKFSPFGVGNPAPAFVTNGVFVKSCKIVGKDRKHCKLVLKSEGRDYDAIAFGAGVNFPDGLEGKTIDVLYNFEKNYWNGNVSMQLKIKDIILHE